jgi:hypothetical protein
MSKRARRHCDWRFIFGLANEIVGHVEQQDDQLWHVIVRGLDIGSFASEEAAKAFAHKVTNGAHRQGRADDPR